MNYFGNKRASNEKVLSYELVPSSSKVSYKNLVLIQGHTQKSYEFIFKIC